MQLHSQKCLQCGSCCIEYAGNITATWTDIERWILGGRQDVLQFFFAKKKDGSLVHCTDTEKFTLNDLASIEMRVPETLERFGICPFLQLNLKERSSCSIHETKPEVCRNYTPWEWGNSNADLEKCPLVVQKLED